MADLQITQLPSIASGSVAATDPLALADVSGSQTVKVTVKDLVARGVAVIDAGTIPATSLSYPLTANSIVTASILDANVTNAKLEHSSISLGGLNLVLGSTDATPALDLTDATNYPTSSLTGTITNDQLAGSIDNAKLSNSSISLAGVSISLGGTYATPALDLTSATNYPTSSLTGTITNAQLAGSIATSKLATPDISLGTVSISLGGTDATPAFDLTDATNYPTSSLAGTITNAQLAGSIAGSKLINGTITSLQLDTNSVTSVELADNACDTAAIASLAVTDGKINDVSGTKVAAGTLPATALNISNIDRGLNVSSNNIGIANACAGGASTRNGITYTNEGLISSTSALVPSDIPEATASALGGVSVPTAGGLSVTNLGALSIANSISAITRSGLTFNTFGQLTSSVALVGADLPVATDSVIGAIKVPTASAPLALDANGVLSIADSGVTAGQYEKVTVNASGIITAGSDLVANDIPALDASKITTGQLGTSRILDDAITMDKLGSNAISFIQEAQPDITNLPTGVYWLQESTGQLRIFNGNSWFSVGFGRLAEENLRFCGTFNATNGLIVNLTTFGTSAGFTAGNAIPAGTASLTGTYFVCTTPGNGTAVVSGTSFDVGDWVMCIGATGWQRVDTLSGPGSVSALDDLSDVTIASPTAGQFFEYASDGQWKNVSVINGGTY
jgi:hypothetical protein